MTTVRLRNFAIGAAVVAMNLASAAVAGGSAWLPGFSLPGTGHEVLAMAVHDDGSGAKLSLGGTFDATSVLFGLGGTPIAAAARWNGFEFEQVGAGFPDGVFSLVRLPTASGTKLIAGGAFTVSGATSVNRVAWWDGAAWQPLGM